MRSSAIFLKDSCKHIHYLSDRYAYEVQTETRCTCLFFEVPTQVEVSLITKQNQIQPMRTVFNLVTAIHRKMRLV